MKKEIKKVLLMVLVAIFVACDNENDLPTPPVGGDSSAVCYVLNAGDWKSSNSSLTKFDLETGAAVQNYFEYQNGRCLGNTANDMLVHGSKMYIAVSGESTIEVASLDAKSIKQIKCSGQPRYLAANGDNVYVTYYDGNVARIDTATLEVDAMVAVGRNPEQLAVCDGKLYVANSGGLDYNTALGYDNTVSVIDVATFSQVAKVEVTCNPAVVVAAGNEVYVASYGNYYDVPSTLQRISPDGGVSVVKECSNMTEICYNSGRLYGFFSSYDANWNATITYQSYDVADKSVDTPWIKESFLPTPYKVCAAGEYVCVTSSDYINDGDTYLYDTDGMLVHTIPSGLNPVKAVVIE
jgi:YVTN family beta-propeller protein